MKKVHGGRSGHCRLSQTFYQHGVDQCPAAIYLDDKNPVIRASNNVLSSDHGSMGATLDDTGGWRFSSLSFLSFSYICQFLPCLLIFFRFECSHVCSVFLGEPRGGVANQVRHRRSDHIQA